jgi:hypothetical protein
VQRAWHLCKDDRAPPAEHDAAGPTGLGKEVLNLGAQPPFLEIELLHLPGSAAWGGRPTHDREEPLPAALRSFIDCGEGLFREARSPRDAARNRSIQELDSELLGHAWADSASAGPVERGDRHDGTKPLSLWRLDHEPASSPSADDHATMTLPPVRPVMRRLARAGSRAFDRTLADAWPLLQGTAAATAAWVIAKYVFDHEQPFFAPIAALVALNTSLGERGLNAVRLLQGVFLGIVVGEATLETVAGGAGSMAVGIFVATALARALGGTRIVIAQAAVSAILTVALADAEAGVERLTDALIGTGVALVFSQLLFSPEPVALLRRAEGAALEHMAGGLALTARALEQDDDELAEQAIAALRELPHDVAELRRVRRASSRVARRTLVWRGHSALVVRESENADHLDLLGGSCLLLARFAPSLTPPERRALEPSVRGLAGVLDELAHGLRDRETRRRAAGRALEVANAVFCADAPAGSAPALAVTGVRLVATDLMVFAGVNLDDAVEAVREGILQQRIAEVEPAPRRRFAWLRRLLTG